MPSWYALMALATSPVPQVSYDHPIRAVRHGKLKMTLTVIDFFHILTPLSMLVPADFLPPLPASPRTTYCGTQPMTLRP